MSRFEGRVLRQTSHPLGDALRLAWLLSCILLVLAMGLQLVDESGMVRLACAWAVFSALGLLVVKRLAPRRTLVDLVIDERGIEVARAMLAARDDLSAGAVFAEADGTTGVAFRSWWRWLAFVPPRASDAAAMLAAANVATDAGVLRVSSLRPRAVWQVGIGVLVYVAVSGVLSRIFWLLHVRSGGGLAALLAGAALAVYAIATRTTVTVGSDGVEVRRGLSRRFVPIDAIRGVGPDADVTLLLGEEEDPVVLARASTTDPVGGFGEREGALERFVLRERIVRALARRAGRGAADGAAGALGRGDRTAEEWFASLRAIAGGSDYRTRGVPVEDLERVASDAGATSDARVGAAVAWRIAEGAAVSARLRVIAEATVAPELRSALRSIADDAGEDALEDHVRRLTTRPA